MKYTNFAHFVITRFNLRQNNSQWRLDKSGNEVLTKEWMEERLKIFEKYCLPSVINQTQKNFHWIIYIDSQTSSNFLRYFKRLVQKHDFIIVLPAPSYQSFQENHTKHIVELTAADKPYVITTRLDNDDMLHKHYIKKVQEQFDFQSFLAVNFLKIMMLDPSDKNKLYIDYQFSNHFISLIEKITENGIQGCYSRGDRHWNVKGQIQQIDEKAYCAEIISNQNLLNTFRGFPILKPTPLDDFNLQDKYRNRLFDRNNFNLMKMSWLKFYHYKRLSLGLNNFA